MSELTITIRFQNPREAAAAQAAQARGEAEAARIEAQAAAREARAEADAARAEANADQAGESGEGAVVTIVKPNGQTITLTDASPEAVATALGMPVPEPPQENDAPYVIGAIAIISTAVVVLSAMKMWYRVYMQKGTGPSQLPSDFTQRMTRMENAIESVAVEVERISEGQRFTTRLLSDRAPQEVPRG